MASMTWRPRALWVISRRAKANHSLPQLSLSKYRREYSGTKTRHLASAVVSSGDHWAPILFSRSMNPASSGRASVICNMAAHRSL